MAGGALRESRIGRTLKTLAGDWGTTCSETSEWWDRVGAAAGAALFAARQSGQSCAGRSFAVAGADSAGAPNEQAWSAAACTRGCTTACSNSKSASQAFVRFTNVSIVEFRCGRTRFSVIALTWACLVYVPSCGASDPRERTTSFASEILSGFSSLFLFRVSRVGYVSFGTM